MAEQLSMDQVFVKKLDDIVEANLENELFGVKELAEEIGLSRSQLHHKLQVANRKSASQFIREYRLQKAMIMLQRNEATASEIAYRVGFGSPTYFNTCFHEFYGYPPGEVKFRESFKTKESFKKQRKYLILLISFVLIISLSYFFYQRSQNINNTDTKVKSIAVIPFKDWSGNQDMEHMCDGMTDAIISRLTKINSITKIIPFTSTLKYKNKDKSIQEIANELGVQTILQGNLQRSGDQIKFNLQLVDGVSNTHFWVNEYIFKWQRDEIFNIQFKIAEDVAKNIDAIITDKEYESIQEYETSSEEAYTLFLQAEHLKRTNNEIYLKKAIQLYEQVIELDHNYTNAKIGLAESLILGGFLFGIYDNKQDDWLKAKDILNKVVEIDSMNFEAHVLLFTGNYYYDWDFKLTEDYYQSNLQVNGKELLREQGPIFYAIKTGRAKETLEVIEKNIKQDESDRLQYLQKAEAYYFDNQKNKCLETLESYETFFLDDFYFLIESIKLYYYLGKYEKTRFLLNHLMGNFPGRPPMVLWLKAVHQHLDGNNMAVQNNLDELRKKYDSHSSGSPAWFLALYYCHIKDYETAFEWLQRSYERREVEMPWLREEPLLIPVRNDARYKELYAKIGFPKV